MRPKKSSLFRAANHPRIINQFRGAVITVCFRAIARMVSAGKRSKGTRRRRGKKIEQPVGQEIGSTFQGKIDRGKRDTGMAAARMQFFSIRRKQRAVDKICIILHRAVPVR